MREKNLIKVVIALSIVILTSAAIVAMLNRHSTQQLPPPSQQSPKRTPAPEPPRQAAAEPEKTETETNAKPEKTLNDIIRAARGWGPIQRYWYGDEAPDFTLGDITGRQHKLSDYRGKNVMLNFWATWCPPCRMEMPHLIELRNSVGEDKLALLAISYITPYPPETPQKVKDFVAESGINYTVFSVEPVHLPAPFDRITSLPSNFFIDPEGKIKLATTGVMSLEDIKTVLKAEW